MVNHNTMLKQSENKLEEIFVMNKDFQYMRFEDPIQGAQVGDVVENLNYIPDVLIEKTVYSAITVPEDFSLLLPARWL